MAYIGVRKPFVVPFGSTAGKYGAKVAFGKATSFEESPNNSNATLYGDDALAESDKGVTSANLTVGTTDIPAAAKAVMYGHTVASDVETSNIDDEVPYCGFAVIGVKVVNGERSYEVRCYPKTQWSEPGTSITTRGESTEFQTPSTEGVAMANDDGDWRIIKDCATEADALSFIDTKFPTT